MGLADVEANYAVVKAYQFTTLTSIQVRENGPDPFTELLLKHKQDSELLNPVLHTVHISLKLISLS